jgi:hypothetical protein
MSAESLRTTRTKPKAVSGFLISMLVFAGLAYGVVAIGTNDPFWFLQRASGSPAQIAIHIEGETVWLLPDDPAFAEVSHVLQATLSKTMGYNQFLGLSEQSLLDYRTQEWTFEAFYTEPLTLHSQFRFGEPHQVFIPLSGGHAENNAFFLGNEDNLYAGPYLESTLELRRTLEDLSLAPQ